MIWKEIPGHGRGREGGLSDIQSCVPLLASQVEGAALNAGTTQPPTLVCMVHGPQCAILSKLGGSPCL